MARLLRACGAARALKLEVHLQHALRSARNMHQVLAFGTLAWSTSSSSTSPTPSSGRPLALRRAASRIMQRLQSLPAASTVLSLLCNVLQLVHKLLAWSPRSSSSTPTPSSGRPMALTRAVSRFCTPQPELLHVQTAAADGRQATDCC